MLVFALFARFAREVRAILFVLHSELIIVILLCVRAECVRRLSGRVRPSRPSVSTWSVRPVVRRCLLLRGERDADEQPPSALTEWQHHFFFERNA